MTCSLWHLVVLSLVASSPSQETTRDRALIGFPGSATTTERALEERFANSLDAEHLRTWLQELSASPHHTGSPGSRRNAEWIAQRFRSWGFETEIETFYALMSTPETRVVEMVAPHSYVASLTEDGLPGRVEADAAGLPPYNVFSRDGEVLASTVYVNYGLAEDYDLLSSRGIDVQGKIVVARYGMAFRAVKTRLAGERGAAGAILFSDPADVGSARGAPYPAGPFLPADGVQRGSVMDLTRFAGDPLTPGRGATRRPADSTLRDFLEDRASDEALSVLSPVPVLPLSARDVQPILAAMQGPAAPPDWQGALPIPYRLGGNVTVRLQVAQKWEVVPLYDVVAKLEGSTWPDEWVLRGNNHDAWNYGALVAGSGLVSMMEEGRAIAELTRSGWRPKRTLVYLAWDGEEQGLMGSTEWAETHADLLRDRAVAYLNTGVTTRGFFTAGGSHALESLVDEIATDVQDPEHGVDVRARWSSQERQRDGTERSGRYRLEALGLGSDYTPFLHHLGIPSLDYAFDGEADSGVYHSIYDTFDFYDRFGDPGFVYGKALAEATGRTVLRLVNADVLPFDFRGMSETMEGYLAEIEALARSQPAEISLDLRPLTRAHEGLARAAARFHQSRAAYEASILEASTLEASTLEASTHEESSASLDPAELAELNGILRRAEQQLAPKHGLPGRPWYRHQVYAPDDQTGYGVETLPALRDAIEREDRGQTKSQIRRVAATIDAYARQIDRAARILERHQPRQ